MKLKRKCCWIAKRYRKGWRLGLAIGEQPTQWIPKFLFMEKKDVEQALASNCVFVFMSTDKVKEE